MEHLWSPWRLTYVTTSGADQACPFCEALERLDRPDSLVVHRGVGCFVILNLFPYNNGHLMVVPDRHIGSLAEATSDELCEIMELTRRAEVVLMREYEPHGLNMGINLGRPAGAGVLDHVHMHVVPRWNGDTNFMSVVGNVRVLPEELGQTAERLRAAFAEVEP